MSAPAPSEWSGDDELRFGTPMDPRYGSIYDGAVLDAIRDELAAAAPEERALCEFRLFAGSYLEPPEYCDEPIEHHGDYCSKHEAAEAAENDREERAYDEWKERDL